MRRQARDVVPLEADAAGCRLVDAADEIEDRRLAGAVRADDREDLALVDAEADAVDRLDAAEMHGQIFDLEQCHRFFSLTM